jgi:hypothetical protein
MDAFSSLNCPRISVLRAAKPGLPLSLLAAWFYFFAIKISARPGNYAYQKPTSHLQPIFIYYATACNLSAFIYCSLQI